MIAADMNVFAQEVLKILKNILRVLDSHVIIINREEEEVEVVIAELEYAIDKAPQPLSGGVQDRPEEEILEEQERSGDHDLEEEQRERSDELYNTQQTLSQHLRLRQDRQPIHTKHLRQCSAFKSSLENGILFVMLNALVDATNENRARTVQKLYKTRRQYDVKRRKLDTEL